MSRMPRSAAAFTLLLLLCLLVGAATLVECRKSSSSYSSRGGSPSSSSKLSGNKRRSPAAGTSRRRSSLLDDDDVEDSLEDDHFDDVYDDIMDDDDEEDAMEAEDEYDDEEEEVIRPIRSSPSKKRPPPSQKTRRGGAPNKQRRQQPPPREEDWDTGYDDEYDDDDADDYYFDAAPSRKSQTSRRGGPPPRRGRGGPPPPRGSRNRRTRPRPNQSNNVVGPVMTKASSAFTRGLTTLRESLPDAATITSATTSALQTAKQTTSHVTRTVAREFKGLTSSELEQVMLKATRPDDSPVKGKHVERLVGVTYQVSGKFDLYSSVLRKLWKKMLEDDWRTKIKSLYVLHRFSSDGAPDHQQNLKLRLRELKRSRDPKTKEKYFNTKLVLKGTVTPDNKAFRAFLARYAHYVFLRAQTFSGMFIEIAPPDVPTPSRQQQRSSSSSRSRPPPPKKSGSGGGGSPESSPLPSKQLLEGAKLLCKAASQACVLKEAEVCENTAIAVERVAADMIGLTTAVAVSINRTLKPNNKSSSVAPPALDKALLREWCEFYGMELLPQTRMLVKRCTPQLDAYGLFLPGRMGSSVSKDLLQRGLSYADEKSDEKAEEDQEEENDGGNEEGKEEAKEEVTPEQTQDETIATPATKPRMTEEDGDDDEEEVEAADIAEEDEYEEYDFEDEYYDEDE